MRHLVENLCAAGVFAVVVVAIFIAGALLMSVFGETALSRF
ncbi:MAG: hypothetical protein ACFB00_03825 [Parvularculaceae bacterium]